MAQVLHRRPALDPPTDPTQRRSQPPYLRTIGLYVLTLWAALVTLVFFLPRLLRGDPLRQLQDEDSGQFIYDAAERERVAAYYGLDKPLLSQYRSYLSDLRHGEFGWSISQNQPVSTLLRDRLPWTLLLTGSALALSSLISFFAGVTAAWHRGRFAGPLAHRGAVRHPSHSRVRDGRRPPDPVRGDLPDLPAGGGAAGVRELRVTAGCDRRRPVPSRTPTGGADHRAGSQQVFDRPEHRHLYAGPGLHGAGAAKGLSRRLLKYRHSGRNALLPFVTALGIQAGFAVSGSPFVETIFNYPGLGTLVTRAVDARDYPLLQGCFIALAVTVLIANLAVELTYAKLDPRVRRQ